MADVASSRDDGVELGGNSVRGLATESNRQAAGPSAGRVPGQPNMLARLQAFLPAAKSLRPGVDTTAPRNGAQGSSASVPGSSKQTQPGPRFLKVRIVTWNMHDTLPKGNLEDLLGTVAPYEPYPEGETDKFRVPNMSLDDCHPYHLIVVAGQECPTVSGIPMGLTAGFKGKEKDKHRESASATPPVDSHHQTDHGPTSGWSWILESWFCRGAGQRNKEDETSTASEVYDSQAAAEQFPDPDNEHRHEAACSKEGGKDRKEEKKKRRSCIKKCKTGPYELLAKERLMGIYLAVFIYRDLKPLVKGLSKSAVTTGLIGGRLGNKGGVGISINLDGTSLLFVNAHLAAHGERKMDRVANMAKIKSELQVDDFLRPDDPRVMMEDPTDRFDYTFVFGDLNFRLDITRRHADWLISRQAYDQALAFDQLRALMEQGQAFVGFREGDINFPPTFKYDVFRSLKRDKSRLAKENSKGHAYYKRWRAHLSNSSLSRLEEHNGDMPTAVIEATSDEIVDGEKPANASVDNDDTGSIVSTAVTSLSGRSRRSGNDAEVDSDVYFAKPLIDRSNSKSRFRRGASVISHRQLISKAAAKAKDKWLSLISHPRSEGTGLYFARKVRRPRRTSLALSTTTMPQLEVSASGASQVAFDESKAVSAVELGRSAEHEAPNLLRALSKRSAKSSKSLNVKSVQENAEVDDRKGVYDSSSKQRVPSWCDRILWKSTVKSEPEAEEVVETRLGFGPRFLHFVQQSLRPRNRGSTTQLPTPPPSEPQRTFSLPPKSLSRPATAPPAPSFTLSPPSSPPATILEKMPTYSSGDPLSDLVYHRRWLRTRKSLTKLTKSKSVEPETTVPKAPSDLRSSLRRGRSFSAQTPISQPVALDQEGLINRSGTGTATSNTPGTIVPPPRRLFPSFFYRDSEPSNVVALEVKTQPSVQPQYRKGDVAVLGYRTLDDPGMRRLEGRSDHRPVIGSYALFI